PIRDNVSSPIRYNRSSLRDILRLANRNSPKAGNSWSSKGTTEVIPRLIIRLEIISLHVGRVHRPCVRDGTTRKKKLRNRFPGRHNVVGIERLGEPVREVEDAGKVLPGPVSLDDFAVQSARHLVTKVTVDGVLKLR